MNAMPSSDKILSRRGFIGWVVRSSLVGSLLVGLGNLARFLGHSSQSISPSQVDLGNAADYPPGSRVVVDHAEVVITHTSQGYQALSLVCPHLGCAVQTTPEGFECPCHGSRFRSDGSLRSGPASRPLGVLDVEVNAEGHLIVNSEQL